MKISKNLKRLLSLGLCAILFVGTACNNGTTSSQEEPVLEETAVWVAPGTEKILQNIDYRARHAKKNLEITAFKNEYEGAQIIVTPAKTGKYTIELSDLIEADGVTKLSKDNFSVYHEKYITVNNIFDSHSLTGTGDYPDALVPYQNIVEYGENEIVAGENQGIWVTLHTDKEQKAGIYTGEFSVTVGDKNYQIPVSVTLLDYVLSEETHIKNQFGMNWYEVAQGELDSTVEMQEAYYEFFLDYRCNPEIFPGNEHGIFITGEPVEEFVYYAEKYADDPRVANYDIPHAFLQSCFKVPALDKESKLQYDTNGNVLIEYRNITTNDMPLLKATLEAMLERSIEKNIDLFKKAGHYAFFYDEYSLMPDGDYRVNVNMLLLYRLFQQIAYTYVINESKANGEYAKLLEEERILIDGLAERFSKATYYEQITNPTLMADASLYEEYNQRFNGALDIFYDLMLARETEQEGVVEAAFDILNEGEREVIEKLIGELSEFEQTILCSLENIQARATGPKLDTIVAKTNFISTIDDYDSVQARKEFDEWSSYWFGERGENWCYTCVNPKPPYPSYHLEDELLSSRLLSWMMYQYNIVGNLLWDSALYNVPGSSMPIQDYYQNPNRFPYANGDGFVVYPGREYGVYGPVASIRLEAIRDGSEEYELFYAIEEIYKARAAGKGIEYNEETLDNIIALMTKNMYKGTICSYYDGYLDNFASGRKILNDLVLLAANTGTVIEKLEVEKGVANVVVSTRQDNALTIGGKTYTGKTENGITTYSFNIGLNKNKNSLSLMVDCGGKSYELNLLLGGKTITYSLAGAQGKLSADDIELENATATISAQDGMDVWTLMTDSTENDARVDLNVSSLGINYTANAISVDIYAEEEISFVLYVRVKGGSYSRIETVTLSKGWNTIRLDTSQFSMSETRGLEKIRFKFEGVSGCIKIGDMVIEEKEI